MPEHEQPGFEIKRPEADTGRFYPLPAAFKLSDPPIAERVTGLSWPEFVERLPDEDTDPDMPEDLVAMAGLLAIAIAHEHPQWRRDRVVNYVSGIPLENIAFHGGEDADDIEDEGGDARPPELPVGGRISETSPSTSRAESEPEPSVAPSPSSSGS